MLFSPSTATLLFIIVIILCQLLTMKHPIGRLSAADIEPLYSLTTTCSETFSICMYVYHCVKSVRILSYCCQHFPVFGLNTKRYEKCPYLELFWSAFFRIRSPYLSVFSTITGDCGPE